jgi:TorA maturation chaperone TorD
MEDEAMAIAEGFADTMALDLARECLYRFLAGAISDPHAEGHRLVYDPANQRLASEAADLLRAEASTATLSLGFGELPPDQLDLRPVLEELDRPAAESCAEYDRVFGLVPSRECPPYETEYHSSSEPFFRSQQLADVAGFYRAFGLQTSGAQPERPDHLALELEFMAFLLLKKRLVLASMPANATSAEQARICDEAQRVFFRDHLAWWVPSFAAGLRRKAGSGVYASVARLLAALLPVERARLGAEAPRLSLEAAFIERPEEQPGCAGCRGTV